MLVGRGWVLLHTPKLVSPTARTLAVGNFREIETFIDIGLVSSNNGPSALVHLHLLRQYPL